MTTRAICLDCNWFKIAKTKGDAAKHARVHMQEHNDEHEVEYIETSQSTFEKYDG